MDEVATTEEQEETQEELSILDIPDSEIDDYLAKLDVEQPEPEDNQEEVSEGTEASNEQVEEETESEEEAIEASDDTEDEAETVAESPKAPKKTLQPKKDPTFKDAKETEDLTQKKAELEAEKSDVDYKAEYEKLVAPFKANGKEMQIDNVDDARTLMQMGANYNKKMAALKPNLKIVKILEKNDLLDESKLSFLIDLSKKDPSAINKLIKDSGVDPLDLDAEKADDYNPTDYAVNDKEVELDAILDEIRDTTSFNTTANIISNQWDERSKQLLVDNPVLIKIINEHVEAGIFDKITAVVDREKMLGRLTGLSDIEAYKYVGEAINAQGGFTNTPSSTSETTTTDVKATNKVDPSLNKRKKAASSTKGTKTSTKVDDNFNPLAMSDEEFEKIASSKFI